MDERKIVYTALKPTGALQLGNYIGALTNMVQMQETHNCIYTIADMHSITVANEPADLRRRIYEFAAMFLAIGLDPEKAVIFIQSHVSAHAELAWVLNCFTQFGEASRMTQFKDKSKKNPENINLGLFAYPTLMAADILLYNADLVPIGIDQKQHLELAKTIAERFNNRYSPTFTVPQEVIRKTGYKIQNLLDPTSKMGKTDDNQNGVIFLKDDPDTIMRKFKRAVTDCDNTIKYSPDDKPGVSNLLTIYSVMSGQSIEDVQTHFQSKGYAELKTEVAECVIEVLKPVQARYDELLKDKAMLEAIMRQGAEKASRIANKTLAKVYRKVGFVAK